MAMASNSTTGPAVANGYELDPAHRTAVQIIGSEVTAPQTKKFVQIEVTEVINPRKIPLAFAVHFQPAQGEKFLLGTFSLFPPDNPGKFIVATRGKLRTGGSVVVSLVPLERVLGQDEVRVKLKHITFLAE